MRPGEFDYVRPSSVAEALGLLESGDAGTWVLAGGQSLIRRMRAREVAPRRVVDLSALGELRGIRRDGAALVVGALTPIAALGADPAVRECCAALAECAARIADVQVRNLATAGGNLCIGAGSDVGPVLVASGGEVVLRSIRGERRVAAEELLARGERPCAPDEILVALRFGTAPGSAFEKLSRRTADPPVASVAAFVRPAGGGSVRVGLAAGGVHRHVVRAAPGEAAVAEHGLDLGRLRAALAAWAETLDPEDTPHGGPAYRRRMLPVVAARAVERAARACGEAVR